MLARRYTLAKDRKGKVESGQPVEMVGSVEMYEGATYMAKSKSGCKR